ncbi:3-dehydroquinate synthase [Niabella drilacis]|uniref:3-dehydroquinate synthase n=1 Tax=Niabella drilacis (strain DSM 25811 / CCM 8410 / CCUG 62505 / LMG 26954 / E90) TaxID=1285928 RepID=A0A1G6M235_NIADE|nr:3-dehydroquinate synthase [Niabella drilacis]SDC49417.1 3-dehydroquinate synthase [Niabella drilacis]
MEKIIKFSNASTHFYFDSSFKQVTKIAGKKSLVVITDENIFKAHPAAFKGLNVIVLKPGEAYKVQATVDEVIDTLIKMEADRQTVLVGVGGGVITDLTGYIASVYMRGLRFGFVPTSILALVDASIGGKNGIDVDRYKNLVGIIRQPSFILHDVVFLQSLPRNEWENGFAEIIKHACIKDAPMFKQLQQESLSSYQKDQQKLSRLIQRNALIKTKVVQKDEFEKGDRRLLNLGHTIGHALEKEYELMHGQAVAIGTTYACHISEQMTGFSQTEEVVALLEQYQLPTYADFDRKKVFDSLKMDKKRERKEMNFVLLDKIGRGIVKAIPMKQLEKIINKL